MFSIQKIFKGLHELCLWLRIQKLASFCEGSDDMSGPQNNRD
jgi:hypothetical protein